MTADTKMEPILFLKKDECIPIMRKAWIEKKLSRLSGTGEGCKYRSSHGPCIIGTVLPDWIIAPVENANTLYTPDWMKQHKLLINNVDIGSAFTIGLIKSDDDVWFTELQHKFDYAALDEVADRLGLEGDDRHGY